MTHVVIIMLIYGLFRLFCFFVLFRVRAEDSFPLEGGEL